MSVKDADCHVRYAVALTHFPHVLAYGPPGVGKTHAAVQSAVERDEDFIKITCTDGDMSAEYRGMFIPAKGGSFDFMLGVATKAWVELNGGQGGLLILDEIDHAPPEVHSLLHAMLDDKAIAKFTLPNGRDIVPGPKFRAVGTMNGVPDDLTPALKDRFTAKIRVDRPPNAAFDLLSPDLREKAEVLVLHPDPNQRVSFRSLLAYDRHRGMIGDELCAQLVFDSERWNEVLTAIRLM